MSSPFKTSPCQHDPGVLRDLAYDSARSLMEQGGKAQAEEQDILPKNPAATGLCSDCRLEVLRVSRVLRALFDLKAKSAPFALDGRVVAATQAGHRQHRAIRAIESLTRTVAPEELDYRLRAEHFLPEIAAEDASFDDQAHGASHARGAHSSHADGPQHSAPPELDERVARELSRGLGRNLGENELPGGLASSEFSGSRSLVFGALAAAAALLLLVQLRLRGDENESSSVERIAQVQGPLRLEDEDLEQLKADLGLTFSVRRLNTAEDLQPLARELLDQLSGPRLAQGFEDEASEERNGPLPGEDDRTEEKGF